MSRVDTNRLRKEFPNLKETVLDLKLSGLSDTKIAEHFTELGYTCTEPSVRRLRMKFNIIENLSHNGNSFRGRQHSDETTAKISSLRIERGYVKGKNNYFYGMCGDKAPGWKGGISTRTQLFYRSEEWREKRNFILNMDSYTCQLCNSNKGRKGKFGTFHVHHIIPLSIDWNMRLNNDNLITLCANCHEKTFGKEQEFSTIFQDIVRTSWRHEEPDRNIQVA